MLAVTEHSQLLLLAAVLFRVMLEFSNLACACSFLVQYQLQLLCASICICIVFLACITFDHNSIQSRVSILLAILYYIFDNFFTSCEIWQCTIKGTMKQIKIIDNQYSINQLRDDVQQVLLQYSLLQAVLCLSQICKQWLGFQLYNVDICWDLGFGLD